MQAANETNKNERGIGGGGGLNLASLNSAFLPRACKYELQVVFFISRQHYCIILVASLKKV